MKKDPQRHPEDLHIIGFGVYRVAEKVQVSSRHDVSTDQYPQTARRFR